MTSIVDCFLCVWCGQYFDQRLALVRTHEYMNATVKDYVCPDCFTQSTCPASFQGVHGEVIDLADATEGHLLARHPAPWWTIFYHNGRSGYCSECGHWLFWNVKRQRWWDPIFPEPDDLFFVDESPNIKVHRLVDLKLGDSKRQVYRWKMALFLWLKMRGVNFIFTDNKFDLKCEELTKQFQRYMSLPDTGVVNQLTWDAMKSDHPTFATALERLN